MTTRVKHVFRNNEIGHQFIHNSKEDVRNGNHTFYIENGVCYSYGAHFRIALRLTGVKKKEAIILNSRSYSSTTSQHQAIVRRAIPPDRVVFTVPNLDFGRSESQDEAEHQENLEWYIHRVVENTITSARARSSWKKEHHHKRAVELREQAFAYAKLFGFKKPDIKPIPKLNSADMEKIRAREASADAKRAAKKRAEQQERIKQAGSLVDLWRQGGAQHYLLNAIPPILRIKGHLVETSHGASFPIIHAKRGLKLVQLIRSKGTDTIYTGDTKPRLGHYRIDRIEDNGTVHAGCHVVAWDEIDRVAEAIEEYQPTVKCDQCRMLSINGLPCHETNCPNSRRLWDEEEQTWVAVRGENVDETGG
jgi:hypothetical protein